MPTNKRRRFRVCGDGGGYLSDIDDDNDSFLLLWLISFVFKIKMLPDVCVQLINEMADVEYRLSLACNDKMQLGSLIAAFTRARALLVAAAK